MRWIFFTVLMANVAFFMYGQLSRLDIINVGDGKGVNLADIESKEAPTLMLLSELKAKKEPVESVRVNRPNDGGYVEDDTVVPISRSLCTLVGSFSDRSKAEHFVRRLNVLGVQGTVKNLLVSTTVGFWLHLPPLSSRKELLRRLSELQRQGVDSYVIPDGELQNGISLGMFSELQRAEFLQKTIAQLGILLLKLQKCREKKESFGCSCYVKNRSKLTQKAGLSYFLEKNCYKNNKICVQMLRPRESFSRIAPPLLGKH